MDEIDRRIIQALRGDGRISKDEAAKLPDIAARFEMLDKDKDGSLTLAEFAAGYKAG